MAFRGSDSGPQYIPSGEAREVVSKPRITEVSSKSTPAELDAFARRFAASIGATEPRQIEAIRAALPTRINGMEKFNVSPDDAEKGLKKVAGVVDTEMASFAKEVGQRKAQLRQEGAAYRAQLAQAQKRENVDVPAKIDSISAQIANGDFEQKKAA